MVIVYKIRGVGPITLLKSRVSEKKKKSTPLSLIRSNEKNKEMLMFIDSKVK